ncbi:beta-lactamase [Arthroderma uncinatum]|uniref:beta-lactamase n=1 Tax=Arthroderma uncinatum TaxID=74035 RepID=UPI00144AD5E4|nr:beta-lactamase [Arthroderma uncinatum]KAF3491175.1 beta-lactamase [Arthroderma uncinatum]
MGKSISPDGIIAIRKAVDDACVDKVKGLPGVTVVVVNKQGEELLAHTAGNKGDAASEAPLALDAVYYMASFTKLITGIACMQLVERGELSLDDAEMLERLCPELKEVKVLQDDGTLVPKKKGITLRMLLSHTSGFGYSNGNKKLEGFLENTGKFDQFLQPLVNQPGEKWEYGISIDWAGIVVERATNMRLGAYFQSNIFDPLSIKDISLLPSDEMRSKLVTMHRRHPDGTLRPMDYNLLKAVSTLSTRTNEEREQFFQGGGAGAFGTMRDYSSILAALINGGTSPTTGNRILTAKTVESMFQNQVPDMHNFHCELLPHISPVNPAELPSYGWGLTFMMTSTPLGRSANSGFWAGAPNCYWWCDREHEIGVVIATQVLPIGDANVLRLWHTVESTIYQQLQ